MKKERKVKQITIDKDVVIPGDGSLSYLVLVKRSGEDKTWYSCGEFIDNEEDARLYAASDDLLAVARLVVESQTWDGNDPENEGWTRLYRSAREAIAKATTLHSMRG